MHEKNRRYCIGLELYVSPDMGLCGVENDEDGNQGTYQYLTPQEAMNWVSAWLVGERWSRASHYVQERSHA